MSPKNILIILYWPSLSLHFYLFRYSKRCVLYWYYREFSISSFESLLSNSVLGPGFLWWMYLSLLSCILLSSSVRCHWASVIFWSSNNLNISPFLIPSFKKFYLGASSLYYTKFEEKREKEQSHDLSSFSKIYLLDKTFSSFLEKIVRRKATGLIWRFNWLQHTKRKELLSQQFLFLK